MATLKQIADDISNTLDRPFDVQFKERVKYVFLNELASVLRQEINKRDISEDMKQTYSAPIVLATTGDIPNSQITDTVFKTVNKVSKPVRYNTDEPFVSIYLVAYKRPCIYVTDQREIFYRSSFKLNNITSDLDVFYTYRNGYLYFYNLILPEGETDIVAADKFVIITGVHNTFEFIDSITNEAADYRLGFDEDAELPVSDDIIQLVKIKLLAQDFALLDNRDKVQPTHIDNN